MHSEPGPELSAAPLAPFQDVFAAPLSGLDPDLAGLLAAEEQRNLSTVNLIASESYCPRAALEAEASLLVSKNVYGYPGRRGVAGCSVFDKVEQLALDRACDLFGAQRANIQALSSTIGNIAVLRALLRPGQTILSFEEESGGHHSHGAKYHLSGRDYTVVSFGVDEGRGGLDLESARRLAREHRPALIMAGSTSFPRAIDFAGLADLAQEVGARLVADMAHVSGLVATGLHPNPVRLADVTTTSTHKTLCGPRTGGLVLTNSAELADAIDAELFPGLQGAPGAHIIAGRAALFGIAGRSEFLDLMGKVVQNAQVLATALIDRGLQLYLGGTDTHMVLIDLRGESADGLVVEKALEAHGILANRVTLPARDGDASRVGIRLGTTAMTIRRFGSDAFIEIADLIAQVLRTSGHVSQTISERVQQLAHAHPLPPDFLPVRFSDARGCRI
jgi:glycine hydroxymethyltransferase